MFWFFHCCSDFWKRRLNKVKHQMRSNFQTFLEDMWIINRLQELNCENKMVKNRTVSKSQVQKESWLQFDVKWYKVIYRVVKQNCQVARLHCSEHLNENMVENSSPTCKHNLFELIQSKKKCLLSAQACENLQKDSGSQNCLVPI